MIDKPGDASCGSEDGLAELIEEITSKLQAGEPVDLQRYSETHPEHVGRMRTMLPTLEALHGLPDNAPEDASNRLAGAELPNHTLGDFRIHRELGRGGMGIVYDAQQISLGRRVALKVLPFASMLSPRQLARFQNEARAAASLDHPHIVSVYCVGVERGVHYYAMQYVEGCSLADVIQALRRDTKKRDIRSDSGGPSGDQDLGNDSWGTASGHADGAIPAADTQPRARLSTDFDGNHARYCESVARLIMQAADALHYAHQMGIVHRDIKPSNLMLDAAGQVWITDFGLATTPHDLGLTATGDVLGTLRYMSPEQASGETGVLDHRTDVYSLGITLYELACLRPAFEGENREQLLRRVIDECPVAPRRREPSIPRDLETIILKASAKDSASRYGNAKDLAEDLQRMLDHQPIRARRASRSEHVKSWARRNPLVATLVAVVFTLLGAMAVGATWSSVNLHQKSREIARRSSEIAQKNNEIAQRLFVADMYQANLAVQHGDQVRAERLLLRHVPNWTEDGNPDLRGFEWYHLWDRCHRVMPEHTMLHGLSVYGAAYSPDGKTLAIGEWNGSVRLWDTATGRKTTSWRAHEAWTFGVRMTHDGRTLVTGGNDGQLRFWDMDTHQCVASLPVSAPREVVNDIALSPNEELVAVGAGTLAAAYPTPAQAHVCVWDIPSKKKVMRCGPINGKAHVAFSRDGQRLVAAGFDGKLRVWNTAGWALETTIDAHEACIRDVEFSPDGRTLATASGIWDDGFHAGEIKLWDPVDWTPRKTLHHHKSVVRCVAFSGDGRLLAAGSNDRCISLYDLRRDTYLNYFVAHAGALRDLQFSPDSDYLCSTSMDNAAKIWRVTEITDGPEQAVWYGGHQNQVLQVTFDASGQTAYSADLDGFVHVWDTASGRPQYQLGPFPGLLTCVALSRDGHSLAVASGSWGPIGPGEVYLFRTGDVDPTWKRPLPQGFVGGIEFSPDGRRLAVGSNKQLILFDPATGETVGHPPAVDQTIKVVRWKPNGDQVLFATDSGKTFVWDGLSDAWTDVLISDVKGITKGIAFFPDGERFVTCGGDRMVTYWDANTRERLDRSQPAPDLLYCIDVSPDGKRVATACKDGRVYVWHPQTGEIIMGLTVSDSNWAFNCRFSLDGHLAAGATRGVHLWRAPNVERLRLLSVERLRATCRPD